MWPQGQYPNEQRTWSQLQGDPSREGNSAALVSFIAGLCGMSISLILFSFAILPANSFITSVISPLQSSSITWMLGFFLTLFAIITGHIGLAEAKLADPKRAWRIFAIFGLVLGYLPLLAYLALFAFTLYTIHFHFT